MKSVVACLLMASLATLTTHHAAYAGEISRTRMTPPEVSSFQKREAKTSPEVKKVQAGQVKQGLGTAAEVGIVLGIVAVIVLTLSQLESDE